ncbi:MAG: hypothetical protein IPJ61_18390 [Tessaracoccus sp.]|uniref:hypothetical protein n=1 Tax=Tessaracoccus sp. TaxID=1971211 RepID=UPI001EC50987|nr:hypothetical protein [Tessaracoccus sp.]MBK7822954.1 hypothetical protein [Tessaracoccus sp.]
MSPEQRARALLLNVLWYHQGASSAVGLALRALLGIGRFDHLSDEQLSEAKWVDALLAKAAREPERVPQCEKCSAFFSRFSCNAPDECDCPRCQVYCECGGGK